MNSVDVQEVPVVDNHLRSIFKRQKELMEQYKGIEGLPPWPFDIDDPINQVWIKDFLWRVTEELAEAAEAFQLADGGDPVEELADALHFVVELFILAGLELPHLTLGEAICVAEGIMEEHQDGTLETAIYQTVISCGLAGNTLKNKKWKKTLRPTDKDKFGDKMWEMFNHLITAFTSLGCNADDIHQAYFSKSETNKNRIRTNY